MPGEDQSFDDYSCIPEQPEFDLRDAKLAPNSPVGNSLLNAPVEARINNPWIDSFFAVSSLFCVSIKKLISGWHGIIFVIEETITTQNATSKRYSFEVNLKQEKGEKA